MKGTRGKPNEQLFPEPNEQLMTGGHSATENLLKYVANIIGEPKYNYGQQEQATVRNHNRSTALEPSVLKWGGGGLKQVLRDPNLTLGFCHGSKYIVVRSSDTK